MQLQLVADLGSLQLSNAVAWLGGSGEDDIKPQNVEAVLLDTSTLTMKGLSAVVDADGHRGGNIIREYDEGTQVRLLLWCNGVAVTVSDAGTPRNGGCFDALKLLTSLGAEARKPVKRQFISRTCCVEIDYACHPGKRRQFVTVGNAEPHGPRFRMASAPIWILCAHVQVVLKRPLRDALQRLPVSEVAVSLPSIKASLSDQEYALISSVAGANFSEALQLSDEARCSLQRLLLNSTGHLQSPLGTSFSSMKPGMIQCKCLMTRGRSTVSVHCTAPFTHPLRQHPPWQSFTVQ